MIPLKLRRAMGAVAQSKERSSMQIFNTLTRKKEEFIPQKPGEYRIYVCGPTVYNFIHIGNARPMVVFDTLRRYLEYQGNKVIYVSNITDIDDKLIKKGQEEGVPMQEVARRYEAEYIKDSEGLNVLAPTVRPRATEHIEEILGIVADIIVKGLRVMWPRTATCISGPRSSRSMASLWR